MKLSLFFIFVIITLSLSFISASSFGYGSPVPPQFERTITAGDTYVNATNVTNNYITGGSFNQTYQDFSYNHTSILFGTYGSLWYNMTQAVYDIWGKWFYNQTNAVYETSLLNSTIDLRANGNASWNQTGYKYNYNFTGTDNTTYHYNMSLSINQSWNQTGYKYNYNFTGTDNTTYHYNMSLSINQSWNQTGYKYNYNQTTDISNLVPYTGANQNVDLGSKDLKWEQAGTEKFYIQGSHGNKKLVSQKWSGGAWVDNNKIELASSGDIDLTTKNSGNYINIYSNLKITPQGAANPPLVVLDESSVLHFRVKTIENEIDTNCAIKSTLADGTAPYQTLSTTLNTNLNADLLDGNHAAAFSTTAHTHVLTAGATDVTASKDELNVLDGIPAGLTATELGYVDGVTSAIQTQLNQKDDIIISTSAKGTLGFIDAFPFGFVQQAAFSDADARYWATFYVRRGGSFKAKLGFYPDAANTGKTMAGVIYPNTAVSGGAITWLPPYGEAWSSAIPNAAYTYTQMTSTTAFTISDNAYVSIGFAKTDNAGGASGNLDVTEMVLVRQ